MLIRRIPILALIALVAVRGGEARAGDQPADARAIAKEAFLYGFPMTEGYKAIYAYALDEGGPEYKAPFNTIANTARVYTPADKVVVTPNSDTPYSFAVLDLRAEPVVLTVPAIDPMRYYSIQLIDLYTFNFAYVGTRATGNGAGSYMVAGPDWKGEQPEGVDKVIRCETQIALAIYRTQLKGPEDLDNVKKVQAGYRVQTLSAFRGGPAPAQPAALEWPKPDANTNESPEFFRVLDFLLRFAPVDPSERALRARFATLGLGGATPFDGAGLSAERKEALAGGIADAWKEFEALKVRMDAGEVTSGEVFGTRAFLKNNYLFRFAGAKVGLFGNSRQEAMYPIYSVDSAKQPLDASKHDYTLTLHEKDLAAAKAFWSVTMYDGKTQLLIENPIDRYLINSPMLDSLARNDDGSVTIYLQKDSPGKDKESNWLPAPDGPFYAVLRLYIPSQDVLDGSWTAPPMERAK